MADRSIDMHPEYESSDEELRTNEVLEPFFKTPESQKSELGRYVFRGYTHGRREGAK